MYHAPENELVSWTAAPAARVSFPSGTNGTETVARGDIAGNVTLTAHIEGYAGPPPICAAKVVPETVIPIHAFIICETSYASTNEAGIHSIIAGVNDIYSQVGRVNSVTGLVSRARIPADWGSQVDEGYYTSNLQQSNLVQRLLMFGVGNPDKRDISSGDIQGNWR